MQQTTNREKPPIKFENASQIPPRRQEIKKISKKLRKKCKKFEYLNEINTIKANVKINNATFKIPVMWKSGQTKSITLPNKDARKQNLTLCFIIFPAKLKLTMCANSDVIKVYSTTILISQPPKLIVTKKQIYSKICPVIKGQIKK